MPIERTTVIRVNFLPSGRSSKTVRLALFVLFLVLPLLTAGSAPSTAQQVAAVTDTSAKAASWQRVEIAIPMDEQGIRAAGIATIHVEPDQGKADLGFPGTVTIPQHQLRIVAAPAGGLVESMLVAPDEPVTIG